MNKTLLILSVTLAIAVAILSTLLLLPSSPGISSNDDKIFYALGFELGKNISTLNLSAQEMNLVTAGVRDSALHKTPKINSTEFLPQIREMSSNRSRESAQRENKASLDYLKDIESQSGITKKHQILFKVLAEGKGKSPTTKDRVKVHYEGKLRDGTIFDSSIRRGQPANFPVTGVIPCWTEALQSMKIGSKLQVYCPPETAYGERGSPPIIPGGSALIFEIELLGIENKK